MLLTFGHRGESPIGRREFVRRAAFGCGALFAGGERLPGAQPPLRIGMVAPASVPSVAAMVRGARMGVEEAARTGGLVGGRVELVSGGGEGPDGALAGAEWVLREEGVAALLGGWDEASCRALGGLAESAGVPFLNTGCRADSLRGTDCRRGVFHVEASEAMYAAALAARSAGAEEAAGAALWHPSLERFGAGQVNDRFRARWEGAGMDGAAWAGWMAVKVVWEASLRARSHAPAAVRDYLAREATQFDGHKGWPLSFRPWDRQLRQPLYLVPVDGTRVVGEVPVRPVEGGASSRELLDALAGGRSASTCTTEGGAR